MSLNATLPFGSPRHQLVLEALLARVDMSTADMSKFFKRWDDAEKQFTAEIDEKSVDAVRRGKKEAGTPQYVTINVPFSYGVMMTAHTYLCSVFLSRNPVIELSTRHGEPQMNAEAMMALMDYQTMVGGHLLAYYIRNHDALKYGISIVGTYWCNEQHVVSDSAEEPVTIAGEVLEGEVKRVRTVKIIPGYEGNKVFNVRPKDYIPDTRVPLIQCQAGEFAGRHVRDLTWNMITRRKLSKQYMNIDEARDTIRASANAGAGNNQSGARSTAIPSAEAPGTFHSTTSLIGSIPAIELVVELIPKEWQLGSTEAPEKWIFTIVDRKVVVEARPLGMYHNQFPFNVTETEIEGYGIVKRGFMEISKPLNDIMTWLFNSHFFAVRKATNGDVIYDPTRIYASDLLKSDGTGTRIRVRPEAYGQDVRTMITTMQGGADLTGRHLSDTSIVGDMMQMILGVSDSLSGAGPSNGRKTATQVRTESSGSINRMKTTAEFMSATGYAPLTQMMLQTTQQLYKAEKKFRIAGDSVNRADKFVEVNPELISGFYDYVPVDGTLPLDKFGMVNMWANLLSQIRNFPQIGAQYDIGGIFSWVAQLAGLKNIKQFKLQVVPNQSIGQAGGMVLNGDGTGGGAPGANAGGSVAGGGNAGPVVPLPRQVPGMGRPG